MSWRRSETGDCLTCGGGMGPFADAALTLAGGGRLMICETCATELLVALRATDALTKALQAEHTKELGAVHARLDQVEQQLRERDAELERERLKVERAGAERDQAVDVLGQVRTIIAGNLSAIEEAIRG